MNRGRTAWRHRGEPWLTGTNRVEPAHVPGCLKMFNTSGVNRDEPGRMSNTGVNRGDAGAKSAYSENVRGSTGSLP